MLFKSYSQLLAACGGVVAVVLAGGACAVQAGTVTFSDAFSGPAGASASYGGAPDTIGNGWVIPSTDQASTWQITDTPFSGGALDATQIGSFGANVPAPMVNPGAETPSTGGFTISVDVATPVAASTGDYPGLVFDYQNSDNYYYVRVITATGGAIQMFTVVNGVSSYLSNSSTTLASALAVNTLYHLTANRSSENFTFTLSTTGSSPTTLMTASATNSAFTGGVGGVAETGNDYYSNFSDTYTPVPEPATLGLVALGGLGLLLLKRRNAV